MNKGKYAWMTGRAGGVHDHYHLLGGGLADPLPILARGKYLLVFLSALVMIMMLFVIIGTLRRWRQLIKMKGLTRDPYGVEVKEVVPE